jgi:3-oxoacyl-[acyl-carrier-protein] synthase II
VLAEKGPKRVSPHFVHGRLINLISGQVSIKYGLMGPNHAVVTACSTGAHSIGDAARMIAMDDADIMLAGGAEATICPIGIAGFGQARALSTNFRDEPWRASRPWDQDRDGFVMGEGAGIVVLEEYEHAKARGAKIYAEVVGYGLSGDAYHVTAPHPEGSGAFRSMQMAVKKSGLALSDIDYINAHGTSTPLGDELELGAVRRLFGSAIGDLSMSSTKSAIGHLLGGAGAVESIFCILATARPDRAADAQPRQSERELRGHRPGPAQGQGAQGEGRAEQLVRLRRHQCQPGDEICLRTRPRRR